MCLRKHIAHARYGKLICRYLRRNISKIVRHHAAWPRATAQLTLHAIQMRNAIFNNQRWINHHTFVRKSGGVRRHGPRTCSTHFSMVRAIGGETNQLSVVGIRVRFGKDRRNHGEIWQMRTAKARVIHNPHLSGGKRIRLANFTHAYAKRAQVNWNVWRVHNKKSIRIKQAA